MTCTVSPSLHFHVWQLGKCFATSLVHGNFAGDNDCRRKRICVYSPTRQSNRWRPRQESSQEQQRIELVVAVEHNRMTAVKQRPIQPIASKVSQTLAGNCINPSRTNRRLIPAVSIVVTRIRFVNQRIGELPDFGELASRTVEVFSTAQNWRSHAPANHFAGKHCRD